MLDLEKMIAYINQIKEVDTDGVLPMSHVYPACNVFREDVVTNCEDASAQTLQNAPQQKDGGMVVPKTIGE